MREAARRHQPVAVSDITLLEIALLYGKAIARPRVPIVELLGQLGSSPTLQIIPFTIEIAAELAAMGGSLRDPSDRAIVSTARVHRLRLLTSDQRIIDSELVPVVV
jgi:PIN domain nuclease of toxin-antitoxin system